MKNFVDLNKKRHTIVDLVGDFKNRKIACLTLDIEQDYGELLDKPGYEGLQYVQDLVEFLKERGLPITCFVQGSLFETHPVQIGLLSTLDVDFELHSYSHPNPKESNTELEINRGKESYRKFFEKDPIGYRAPLGVITNNDYEILASNGFKFDSSIVPSIRPGAFNNLFKPTKPYLLNDYKIIEFPYTVLSAFIRIPMNLSYINLMGRPYLHLLKILNLPNPLIFGFHLHDLFTLSTSNKIPLEKHSPIYREIFRKIYQKTNMTGLFILSEFIDILQKKGYMFHRLDNIYVSIIKQGDSKLWSRLQL